MELQVPKVTRATKMLKQAGIAFTGNSYNYDFLCKPSRPSGRRSLGRGAWLMAMRLADERGAAQATSNEDATRYVHRDPPVGVKLGDAGCSGRSSLSYSTREGVEA
jgi:hypothetical protein